MHFQVLWRRAPRWRPRAKQLEGVLLSSRCSVAHATSRYTAAAVINLKHCMCTLALRGLRDALDVRFQLGLCLPLLIGRRAVCRHGLDRRVSLAAAACASEVQPLAYLFQAPENE
jgi:hypothetical protein